MNLKLCKAVGKLLTKEKVDWEGISLLGKD
jgi:hypothetical protein